MGKNKEKVWLARDKNGELWLYQSIPNRDADEWFCKASCCKIDSSKFPSVKWEDDEPTEAYITLTEPQAAKEIDWEQRRYEIAKDLLKSFVSKLMVERVIEEKEMFAKYVINIADTLINELKNQSDEL